MILRMIGLLTQAALLAVACLCWQESRRPDCFVTVGAYQKGAGPRHAHTWAVLAVVHPDGRQERHAISWMPRSERVRLLSGPVPGENWTEERTLAHARAAGCRVRTWGPYPVDDAFRRRFLSRKADLESGRLLYAALDHRVRPGATNCMNCITAVISIDGDRPRTGLMYGYRASFFALEHLLEGR